jgi:16S rRNA (guanine527-N7)-methyltransferase
MPEEPAGELPFANGLICLKGGDLSAEIAESGTRPKIREIIQFFPEESFRGKYILYVPGIPAPHLQRKGPI